MDKKVKYIHKLIRRGASHETFCEDFLSVHETESFVVAAVFDGCSSGKDSHFASSLFGKIFDRYFRVGAGNAMPSDVDQTTFAASIIKDFISYLIKVKASLVIDIEELLSTIVLMVYSKNNNKAFIIGFGDGYIHVDGQGYELKNQLGHNMPSYIAYDLEKIAAMSLEELRNWMAEQDNAFFIEDANDISISTDGIYTFVDKNNSTKNSEGEFYMDIATDLMLNSEKGGLQNPAKLSKNINVLRLKHGVQPLDDISIIRLVLEKEQEESKTLSKSSHE